MKKVTLQHIAERTGYSKFAVSRALSGKGGISAASRKKIIDEATMLGYFNQKKPSKAQTNPLSFGKSEETVQKNFVVILLTNAREQSQLSPYWGKIVEGASVALEKNNLELIVVTESSANSFRRIIHMPGMMGLIGIGEGIPTSLLLETKKKGFPIVLVDYEDPLVPTDCIFMANYDGIRNLTNYLIGIGHREIQFVGNLKYSRSFFDRWSGFKAAMEENGLSFPQDNQLLELQNIYSMTRREYLVNWMESKLADNDGKDIQWPTAYICANDYIAQSLISVLAEKNISVPSDCSVTGFDNLNDFANETSTLTTINVFKEFLGERAVEMLLRRINHGDNPFEKIQVFGEMIIRASVASRY